MAEMIPDRLPSRASAGEKRLFNVLQRLPDDYIVYHEPMVGNLYPDFIVICPDRGLLVIEVKGWYPRDILAADTHPAPVHGIQGEVRCKHPVRQAREYMLALLAECRRHPAGRRLLQADGEFANHFIFPFGHCVILSNITFTQLQSHDVGDMSSLFSPSKVVTRDLLETWDQEGIKGEELCGALKQYFDPVWPVTGLDEQQIAILRAIIHPETVIQQTLPTTHDQPADSNAAVYLKVLDHKQVNNARMHHAIDPEDGPIIIKRSASDGSSSVLLQAAFDNEIRILERLQGVLGCPNPLRHDVVRREFVIRDIGGVLLSQSGLMGNADIEQFLALAELLARILAGIHERGVVHKAFNPTNMLIRCDGLQLQVIDFTLATSFAEERPDFAQLNHLLGDPAYMSPEQTGRMNRPVDYRADLYSLGATLYALATGAPPFGESDMLNLVHAHLARTPLAPHERALWLPLRVSELILTLLAKEPNDRYRSAAGVAHDLHRLRQAFREHGNLDMVTLRERDFPISPRPPQRIYGRDRELAVLLSSFSDVTKGGVSSLFVAGYSGVGKTALIREIFLPVTLGGGLFASGKFEQFQHDRPLLALAQCLQQLCQLLLADSEHGVEQWRQRVLAGLGTEAGVLFEVVPELEILLGPQATPPLLGPIETKVRLRTLLIELLRCMASPEQPLVLFLDDLQWADQLSLDFLEALLEETRIRGVLLIGAYRDNEVDAAHPFMRLLRRLTSSGKPPTVLTLGSLTREHIAAMLADMLRMSPDNVHSLADILFTRTGGNPFFTVELLNALYREGSLRPDPEQGTWRWDTAAIFAHAVSANVVEFLTAELTKLEVDATDALVAAACLGASCTLGVLAQATGIAPVQLAEQLRPALERGIITTPSALVFATGDASGQFRFCHDRMHQAVYQLRDQVWRTGLHLEIARRFSGAECNAASQHAAAEHYALAVSLLTDATERAIAQGLFLNAAIHARQSGAFDVAERFLRLGIEQLAADVWQSQREVAFALHAELHTVLYSQSRHAEADAVYAVLEQRAETPLRLVEPASVQIVSLSNRTRNEEAIRIAGNLLEQLGVPLPLQHLANKLHQELERFYGYVQQGALDRMPDSPELADEVLLAAGKVMNWAGPAAFFCHPDLSLWLQLRLVRLWIENGFCAAALFPAGYLIFATIMHRDDYATGYRIACTAMATGEAREHGVETARTQHVFGLFNNHWFQPVQDDIKYAHTACSALSFHGEFQMGCYTFFCSLSAIFDTCEHISELSEEVGAALNYSRKHGNTHGELTFLTFQQLVHALEGTTDRPGSFNAEDFAEEAHLIAVSSNTMALCFFHVYRAIAACLFSDEAALIRHAEAAVPLLPYITGFYSTALATMLISLALIAQIKQVGEADKAELYKRLDVHQAWLKKRADDAPMNFSHLFDLVEAERLDALNRPWEALQLFEQAMQKAKGAQRPWHHTLITERAGACFMRNGFEHAGRLLLTRAWDGYARWGAQGKAWAMRVNLPFVEAHLQHGMGITDGALDHEALLRASRALASETTLAQLVARVVDVVGKLTSATDVRLLVMDEADAWFLEGGVRGEECLSRIPLAEAEKQGLIAVSVMRMGLKTLKPIVSDDAVIDSRFRNDPHFVGMPLCSLLAVPVLVHGRCSAYLTLENRLFRAAFTTERLDIVTALSSQFAISIENVRLYQSLERKVAERTSELSAANAKLQQLSERDGLTGLANRRKFDLTFEMEWRRAVRHIRPLALLMLDVDKFKAYNDHYGHQAGDDCLKRVASVLNTITQRSGELAARYGGEEFVVILPDNGDVEAFVMAQRIRAAIEDQALPHAGSSVCGVVTVSIGVASQLPRQEDSPHDLLRKADEALYRAKAQGRNQVVMA